MKYVFVGGRPSTQLDYSYDSIKWTNNLLISMIDVLNSNNSHSKSFSFFKSLHEMNYVYRKTIKYNVFLDSGGYSIIVGDVGDRISNCDVLPWSLFFAIWTRTLLSV